jgi:Spx/MgsR family transcriptional regulator
MLKIYGITGCSSVAKALRYLREREMEYEFIDFKKSPVGCEEIDRWLGSVDISTLFNKRGTKYRLLGLKDANLDEEGMREWLCRENLLIKRPVIETGEDVIVGFDEDSYRQRLGG